MAGSSFIDVCRFNPTAGGTADWTYSSAVTGYQSPSAAGAVNGAQYSYRAESSDLSQWEVGFGTYNSGTGVLTRTVLFNSSGTTSKINFSVAPQVAIVALAEDLTVTKAASASDQEAASSAVLAVTPSVQQRHPSSAKAWAYFDGKTGGVVTIKSSYGISSIVRNAAGTYTVTFSTAFSSATAYTFTGNAVNIGVSASIIYVSATSDIATTTFKFQTAPSIGGASADCDIIALAFYGDQ